MINKKSKKIQEREKIRTEFYEKIEKNELNLQSALVMLRKIVGKNQEDFAKLVGVSKKVITDFESGTGNPTLNSLKKMFAPMGLDISIRRKS